jgi:hypothetical protein
MGLSLYQIEQFWHALHEPVSALLAEMAALQANSPPHADSNEPSLARIVQGCPEHHSPEGERLTTISPYFD